MKRRFACLAIGFVAALFACGTASAQASGTVALPRSITDVLASLEQASVRGNSTAEVRAVLDRPVPANPGRIELLRFHSARVQAALSLGMYASAEADLRFLADALKGDRLQLPALEALGSAQLITGKLAEGMATFDAVQNHQFGNPGLETVGLAMKAMVSARLGDLQQARADLVKAEAIYDRLSWLPPGSGPGHFIHSHRTIIESARAYILVGSGKWEDAEASFAAAMDALDTFARRVEHPATGMRRAILVTGRIANLLNLARFDDAEVLARTQLTASLESTDSDRANSVVNISDVYAARGRFAEAALLAERGLGMLAGIGLQDTALPMLHALIAAMTAAMGEEDFARSARYLDRILEPALARSRLTEGFLLTRNDWALALVRTGRSEQATGLLDRLIPQMVEQRGTSHYSVGEARGLRAMAYAATGRRDEALSEFAAATEVMLARGTLDSGLHVQGLELMLRRHIFEAYMQLLSERTDFPDAAAIAFRIADALRGAAVQQAVLSSAVRASASDPGLGALVRRDQDSRLEATSLRRTLLDLAAMPPTQRPTNVMDQMRQRLRDLDTQRAAAQEEIERRYPGYAHLVNPRPASIEQARAALRADEALVSIHTAADRTYVWTVSGRGTSLFHVAKIGEAEIARIVARLRLALDPGQLVLTRLAPFDLAAAHRLHAELLAPGEATWSGAATLVVSVGGALGQIPLAVLPTRPVEARSPGKTMFEELRGVPWLARRVAVVSVPSVTAFARLRALSPAPARRRALLGFGDPDFAGNAQVAAKPANAAEHRVRSVNIVRASKRLAAAGRGVDSIPADWTRYGDLSPLPDTRDELLAIADALGADRQKDIYLGRAASRKAVLTTKLDGTRVIVFATHGLVPGDLPGLHQPALALAASDDPRDSPLLTLEDVLSLKLDADWVVLSACSTASGDGDGAEAVSGLGRGFFYAGARSLLATHWPVETVSARLLTSNLFALQAADPGLSRAQALNRAMLGLMENGAPGYSYAHPIFWAPYALFGDGGR